MSQFKTTIDLLSLDPQYPIYQKGHNLCKRAYEGREERYLDKVQIQLAYDQFAILVRHNTELHWCGYALVPESNWKKIPREAQLEIRRGSPKKITFEGFSTAYITWANYTKRENKLSASTNILKDEPDHWLGFDYYGHVIPAHKAASELEAFSDYIRNQINAHLGS